jgi:hypothetical protein
MCVGAWCLRCATGPVWAELLVLVLVLRLAALAHPRMKGPRRLSCVHVPARPAPVLRRATPPAARCSVPLENCLPLYRGLSFGL